MSLRPWETLDRLISELDTTVAHTNDREAIRVALDRLRPLLHHGIKVCVVTLHAESEIHVYLTAEAERYLPPELVRRASYIEVRGDFEGGWKAKVLKTPEPLPHLPKMLATPTDPTLAYARFIV